MKYLARLQEQITSAGIPCQGVYNNPDTSVGAHLEGATAAQQTAAQNIITAFDDSDAAEAAWVDAKEPLLKDLKDQAAAGIAAIDNYLLNIADSATNAQVRAEVKLIDQRQKRIINALARIVVRTWK